LDNRFLEAALRVFENQPGQSRQFSNPQTMFQCTILFEKAGRTAALKAGRVKKTCFEKSSKIQS
jgi:hypothetical protein